MSLAADLNTATWAFINAAKKVMGTQAAGVRVAVVGGSAIINFTDHRATNDVDFYIAGMDRRKLRNEIATQCNVYGESQVWTRNTESVCGLVHTIRKPNQSPVHIKVDIIDKEVTGWEVSSLHVLAQLAETNLPWGSRDDLICTKLKSAYERVTRGHPKGSQDLADVEALLDRKPGVLANPVQKEFCAQYLSKLLSLCDSELDKKQWEKMLGITLP